VVEVRQRITQRVNGRRFAGVVLRGSFCKTTAAKRPPLPLSQTLPFRSLKHGPSASSNTPLPLFAPAPPLFTRVCGVRVACVWRPRGPLLTRVCVYVASTRATL